MPCFFRPPPSGLSRGILELKAAIRQSGVHSESIASAQSPADLLRDRLTQGRGRLPVIAATTMVWLMDLLLAQHLERDQVIEPSLKVVVTGIERAVTLLFVVLTLGLLIALLRGLRRPLFRWGLVSLSFSVVQVIANVMAMIFTAGHHQGDRKSTRLNSSHRT